MKVEVRLVHRLEGRNQHRKILGQAASHDGVYRSGMDRQLKSGGRVGRNHRLWGSTLESKRRVHALNRWRNNRQAIGPPLLITVVDGGEQVVRDLVDAGIARHGGSV